MRRYWKDIPGYDGDYEISTAGEIVSHKHGFNWDRIPLAGGVNSQGYKTLLLYKNGKRKSCSIHRLVAEIFIPNPNNLPEVNHKDGNKLNNWKWNLEWTDESGNANHAFKLGLRKSLKGEQHGGSKLTKKQVLKIKSLYKGRGKGPSQYDLAKKFKVSRAMIGLIVTNKNWNHEESYI